MIKAIRDFFLYKAAPFIGWLYLRFVEITSEINFEGVDLLLETLAKEKSVIYAFWHNRLFAVLSTRRYTKSRRVNVIISQHKDGEILTGLMDYFGVNYVRGSARRGGINAAKGIIKAVANSEHIAVAPDGPRGPSQIVGEGTIEIAQKYGIPIIPISGSASRKILLKSWDRCIIPLPFSRICFIFGAPIVVEKGDEVEKQKKNLENVLNTLADATDSRVIKRG